MEFIIFIVFIHFSFIVRINVEIFSDQMNFLEQLQQNLKIIVKLVDLKKQIINSTDLGHRKEFVDGTGRTSAREGPLYVKRM